MNNNQFFLYDEKVESNLKKAKHLLMLSMNGVVSENMSSLDYRLNYGVSLPRIIELSKRFPKDSLVANCFWNTNCRELKILATLLYPEDKFTEDLFFQWLPSCSTMELAEQLSRNLLIKLPWANSLIMSVSVAKEPFHLILIFLLATRQIQLALFDFKNRNCLLEVAAQCLCSDDYKVATSVIRFLKLLSRTHSNEVLAFLELMKDRDAHYYQIAHEEVLTEINFY